MKFSLLKRPKYDLIKDEKRCANSIYSRCYIEILPSHLTDFPRSLIPILELKHLKAFRSLDGCLKQLDLFSNLLAYK